MSQYFSEHVTVGEKIVAAFGVLFIAFIVVYVVDGSATTTTNRTEKHGKTSSNHVEAVIEKQFR